MPGLKLAIESDGEKRLEITWDGPGYNPQANTRVVFDSVVIGTVARRSELQSAREYVLPDRSSLLLTLDHDGKLQIYRDGRSLLTLVHPQRERRRLLVFLLCAGLFYSILGGLAALPAHPRWMSSIGSGAGLSGVLLLAMAAIVFLRPSAVEWHFHLRPWESWRQGRIYEWLGVRLYKRHLPTNGDRQLSRSGKRIIRGQRAQALQAYHDQALVFERIHLWISCFTTPLIVAIYSSGHAWEGTLMLALNALLNYYPILVQRYNRARIVRLQLALQEHRQGNCRPAAGGRSWGEQSDTGAPNGAL